MTPRSKPVKHRSPYAFIVLAAMPPLVLFSILAWQIVTMYMPGLSGPERIDESWAASSSSSISSKPPRLLAVAPTGDLPLSPDKFPYTDHAFFDACFRSYYGKNTLTIEDVRNNVPEDAEIYQQSKTRKSLAEPISCASYHANSEHIWTHPTLGFSFQYDRKTKQYRLPVGHVLKAATMVVKAATGTQVLPVKDL